MKNNKDETSYSITMKQDILCLMMAYDEYIKDIKCENDKIYIVMESGKKILYDDKKDKNFEEKIYNSDIQDMMEQIYPLDTTGKLMDKNFDPGRFRVYPLLEDVYGNNSSTIGKNLKNINTPYGAVQFNNNGKAAESLKNVLYELHGISKNNGKLNSYIYPLNGTFNYRHIAGTNLLSPHAFGIAIDLVRDNRDYWKWATESQGQERIASYPKEIVETFEKNNFIWGGKWNHFDTLHFEYRPEIIMKAKYFNNNDKIKDAWYKGAPLEDKQVKGYVDKINKALK
ncbi:glycoside hydrolase [Clostridium botulinum A2B3 87]|uniref:M15 family metallopeptidase n=1 Tax=Clostridium botulinum TaxID=1491 RepID=A0A6G4EIC2_CLOBO|nr:M15 family metallopeptidase [Clostridium botulinum]APH17792.1 D-alanyl-D-alanine carboxypeptidase family protein [Clostridium botulinum]AUM92306.1 glycoside hydrolase [Clostridium botulinum]KEJ02908.1 glycoside hydrolase [Clostridium botulinum A2B3 87]NFB12472.1 M15 family peptidase [Clostridium botulinum]NFH58415.1 M15 family metallopeptidase [Clostridium botulinum]